MMPKYRSKFLLIILSQVLLYACIERFEVQIKRQTNIVVVEGQITSLPEFQTITIRMHAPKESVFEEVYGADVTMESEHGVVYEFFESGLGKYQPYDQLHLVGGDKYRLRVAIGDTIQIISSWQEVPVAVEIYEAYAEAVIKDDVTEDGFIAPENGFNYFVTTEPSPVKNLYLRYNYQTAYIMESPFRSTLCPDCNNCFIVGETQNILRTTAVQNGLGKYVSEFYVVFVPASVEYAIRKTLRLFQFSITEEAYQYYAAIDRQRNINGTIFDPPPAVIEGNLEDINDPARPVYGFFEISIATETSVVVRKTDADFFIPDFTRHCTLNDGAGNVDFSRPECFDCKRMPNSTHERPPWF